MSVYATVGSRVAKIAALLSCERDPSALFVFPRTLINFHPSFPLSRSLSLSLSVSLSRSLSVTVLASGVSLRREGVAPQGQAAGVPAALLDASALATFRAAECSCRGERAVVVWRTGGGGVRAISTICLSG